MATMSEKVTTREQANSFEDAVISVNEKILKKCHDLYVNKENGILKLGEHIGMNLLPPRKKINVMVMGNHSAGKSSFINWYIEEHIQKTGVAIETQGFFFVTSGKKRETLTGNATLHLYPHFESFQEIDGVLEYLTTEVCTSKQKKFPLVTFIDTPGLVDGDMKYPFDVNEAVLWLGSLCDLIFVFFDPMGQALCKRTLDIVEKLNEKHPDRVKFLLSKADEAGHESDRQRVLMQIVQEICKRGCLNKAGFDMPAIFIPNSNKQVRCANQIETTCKDVEKAINNRIQSTLNQLEKDCNKITGYIDTALETDKLARRYNKKAKVKGMILSLVGFLLPIGLIIQLIVASAPRAALVSITGEDLATTIIYYMHPLSEMWRHLGSDNQMVALATVLGISGFLLILSRYYGQRRPSLQNKSKDVLEEKLDFINGYVMDHKHKLYQEYLKQSVSDQDIQ